MKNQQRGEIAVCGFEAVKALSETRPGAVERLFFTEARSREFGRLASALAKARRPYRVVAPEELERLSGTVHHQGVVAMVRDEGLPRVDDALVERWAAAGARVAVLDRVGDDHNLGSIARSAAFFGLSALVLSERDGAARLTTSAYRVARGALERMAVYADESAACFLRRCEGSIPSVGADHRAKDELRSLGDWPGSGRPVAVVLGNEETGLEPDTRTACSRLVRIDGAGLVESLNVAQAAAIFLYALAPRRLKA